MYSAKTCCQHSRTFQHNWPTLASPVQEPIHMSTCLAAKNKHRTRNTTPEQRTALLEGKTPLSGKSVSCRPQEWALKCAVHDGVRSDTRLARTLAETADGMSTGRYPTELVRATVQTVESSSDMYDAFVFLQLYHMICRGTLPWCEAGPGPGCRGTKPQVAATSTWPSCAGGT